MINYKFKLVNFLHDFSHKYNFNIITKSYLSIVEYFENYIFQKCYSPTPAIGPHTDT